MKIKVKLIAILLMALSGLSQAQYGNNIAVGFAISERDMPAVSIEQYYKPNGLGIVLGAYGDLRKIDPRDFIGIDHKRRSFSMGISHGVFKFVRPYACVEYFKTAAYDRSLEKIDDLSDERLESQFGVLIRAWQFCARLAWSTGNNGAIVSAGVNF